MRQQRKSVYRLLSVAMAMMLLISYGWTGPGNAYAKTKSSATKDLNNIQVQSHNKIDKDLKKNFKKHDQVTFLLEFKDQVNTKKVAQKAVSKKKMKTMTTAKVNLMKRSAIVSSLRNKANETQYHVKDFLKKQKKKGNIKKYHSYFIVNMMAVTGTKKVAEKLSKMNEIKKVLPNRTRHIIKQPDQVMSAVNQATKKVKTQAKTSDDDIGENIQHIGAPEAWNQGIDGSGVVVGSIDTGVQWDHPALKEKYRGYDPDHPDDPDNEMNWLDTTDGKNTPYDDLGHGTHTVGTMVGSETDGSNQIGVAPGAKWIAVKAFSALGGRDEDLLEAGQWMLAPTDKNGNTHPEMAPDVINNSWGGGAGKDEFYREMVRNWKEAGIFPAFAAGNVDKNNPGGTGSVASPGNYPESFAVGATDNEDELASFSLQGPSPYDEIKPEIAAPGVNIRSSLPGNKYDDKDGTSMATPAVSGTVALLKQADSSLSVNELEEILINTAKPLTDKDFPESPNNGYGHGGLRAGDAVESVLSGLGTIQGSVMEKGQDNEPPEYQHDAAKITYVNMDLPLSINAKDNIGITKVELQYRSSSNDDWKTVKADRVDGDYKDGTYEATIPKDDITKPSIIYRWRISDYGENGVTTDSYDVDVKEGITPEYFDDFESKPDGWTSFGTFNSWEWGKPNSGPQQAYSGKKVFGTNLDGHYKADANMTLVMPPIKLPEDGDTYLQYKQWYSLEDDLDYGYVFVSTDQENWDKLSEVNGDSNGWEDGQVNLGDYAGKQIYIGFNVQTNSILTHDGMYIDDVSLTQKPEKNQENSKSKKTQGKPNSNMNKPGKMKNIQFPYHTENKIAEKDKASNKKLDTLPLDATITVEETGNSTKTNPSNGKYSLMQPIGNYTLKANAYGFQPDSQTVKVNKDETATANFTLEKIPKGTLKGKITNKQTGEPVKGATVSLVEDAAIKPVQTDGNGHFILKAYEGDYTLHVFAPEYHSDDVTVSVKGNETTANDVKLKPFIGTPGEIGYDDGSAEDAYGYYEAGNKWAVRMSLSKGKDHAMVTGGKFKFWNPEYPDPGGDQFQVEIWDAKGDDGGPGKKIAGPVDATAVRDETQWTQVNLKDLAVSVDDDFYMVYVQTKDLLGAPGMSTDQDSKNAKRSWQYVDGVWSRSPSSEGNYMIRALVDYQIKAPDITSPKQDKYTSDSTMIVQGKSAPNVEIILYDNGKKATTTSTDGDGDFSKKITLSKGKNRLTAAASRKNGLTDQSDPVTVRLDQEKPDLKITSPENKIKTNKGDIEVKGTVQDDYLNWVKVNGQKAEVHDDGTFSKRILLDEGENKIQVIAQDKANNQVKKTQKVYVKTQAPKIRNLKPDKDQTLNTNQSLIISMDTEPGLKPTFSINIPLSTTTMKSMNNNKGYKMMETMPGHYIGVWTAPSDFLIEGASIKVAVKDSYGNVTEKKADGNLFINVPESKHTSD